MKASEINIRDPFVLTVPEKGLYYMYGTRGPGVWDTCSGFDVYKSCDLENWSEPVSVFEKYDDFWATHQFWAPEVHYYHGRYYMFASFKSPTARRGTQILVSDTPDGKFVPLTKEPITPREWECLDGTLYVSPDGRPYIVFSHEWVQCTDGCIYSMALTDDLTAPVGEPKLLFRASEPPFAISGAQRYVTDGPFLYRGETGRLYMLWSTMAATGYVQAVAVSESGDIEGPWHHDHPLLFERDGGHGMIFRDLSGNLKLALHRPNKNPYERPVFFNIKEDNGLLSVVDNTN